MSFNPYSRQRFFPIYFFYTLLNHFLRFYHFSDNFQPSTDRKLIDLYELRVFFAEKICITRRIPTYVNTVFNVFSCLECRYNITTIRCTRTLRDLAERGLITRESYKLVTMIFCGESFSFHRRRVREWESPLSRCNGKMFTDRK